MNNLPAPQRNELMTRLKRIEGQARGIQKMLDDDRDCIDVMNQIASVKAAVNSLSGEMLETFALYCFRHPDQFDSPERAVEQAVRALIRASG